MKVKRKCLKKIFFLNLILKFIKIYTCTLFLTYVGRKYILVENHRCQHTSTNFIKKVRNLQILEAAADRRSAKIGIAKSMIKLLEKYL